MEDEKSVTGGFLNLTDDERHELIFRVLSNIDLSKARRALEHAAKSKLVTDFVQFLTSFSLEKVLRGLILKTAEARLQSGKLNEYDVRHLTEARDGFLSSFDAITGWSDNPEHRQVALTAVLSAFAIGLHGQAQEDLIQGLRRVFAAHEGRRAKSIQEIIERHARDLLDRKAKTFINRRGKINSRGTAAAIFQAVKAGILELQKDDQKKVPPKWRPPKTITDDWKKKAIDRIAHRVKKIVR